MGIKTDAGKTDRGPKKKTRDQRLPVGARGNFLGQLVFCIFGVCFTGCWWLLCALRCPWLQLDG